MIYVAAHSSVYLLRLCNICLPLGLSLEFGIGIGIFYSTDAQVFIEIQRLQCGVTKVKIKVLKLYKELGVYRTSLFSLSVT